VLSYRVLGSAVHGVDHNLADGTITIPKGETSANLSFSYYNNGALNQEQDIQIYIEQANAGVKLGALAQSRKAVVDESQVGPQAIDISAGNTHACGITTTGTLKCWGDNSYGRLGDGTTDIRSSPTTIDALTQ